MLWNLEVHLSQSRAARVPCATERGLSHTGRVRGDREGVHRERLSTAASQCVTARRQRRRCRSVSAWFASCCCRCSSVASWHNTRNTAPPTLARLSSHAERNACHCLPAGRTSATTIHIMPSCACAGAGQHIEQKMCLALDSTVTDRHERSADARCWPQRDALASALSRLRAQRIARYKTCATRSKGSPSRAPVDFPSLVLGQRRNYGKQTLWSTCVPISPEKSISTRSSKTLRQNVWHRSKKSAVAHLLNAQERPAACRLRARHSNVPSELLSRELFRKVHVVGHMPQSQEVPGASAGAGQRKAPLCRLTSTPVADETCGEKAPPRQERRRVNSRPNLVTQTRHASRSWPNMIPSL